MIAALLRPFFASKNERDLKRFGKVVRRIHEEEGRRKGATLEELQEQTRRWQEELRGMKDKAQIARRLDALLPEAFAAVKVASRLLLGQERLVCGRPETWEMVPYDTQLMAGMAMHQGMAAEMATGEGKSLAASLPLYLNALAGRGAHLVTVNDYLAQRDADSIGFLLRALGLTVGCVVQDQSPGVRRAQYECDVTYGTSAEMGFDYLRDNGIALRLEEKVQRGHWFALIDEADSVLIDEARTPLIITGPAEAAANHYAEYRPVLSGLLRKQGEVLNALGAEAAKEKKGAKLGELLFLLKLGNPRHRVLLRLVEDPAALQAMEQVETRYKAGGKKHAFLAFKERLFYTVDRQTRQVDLTEQGRLQIRPDDVSGMRLPDLALNVALRAGEEGLKDLQEELASENLRLHNILQLLRAHAAYERNVDYVIEDGEIVIVDENTGRKMPGRRWSDGLHQAVESKEGLKVKDENHTLATITLQNYFRLYSKLAGMTGTAETEAAELHDIYRMDVAGIPPHRPLLRKDRVARVFATRREKFVAAVELIRERQAAGQPVLVGTASVEASETLARLLRREGIPHQILNAVNHAQEAELIERAGQAGAVTVSTNMAGRGTDIKLGPGVAERGGLLVLGTERYESRRIDRQLRGRCGRQGDPGESLFLLSLEDALLEQSDHRKRVATIVSKGSSTAKQPGLAQALDAAQRKLEQSHYSQRKRTLEMDDVLSRQRTMIYGLRNEAMQVALLPGLLEDLLVESLTDALQQYLADRDDEPEAALAHFAAWGAATIAESPENETEILSKIKPEQVVLVMARAAVRRLGRIGGGAEEPEALAWMGRHLIGVLDYHWQDHLKAMEALRDGIHLQYVAQKDPLQEYRVQAFKLFEAMVERIRRDLLEMVIRIGPPEHQVSSNKQQAILV